MTKRPPKDGCRYCGHERECHVIFKSNKKETQICYPMLGITGANSRWIPGNWCGCQKYIPPIDQEGEENEPSRN